MKATIYKYLDEKGALATIENNSVILKTPLEYNDPFDSLFSTSDEEKDNAYKLFIDYQLFLGMHNFLLNKKNKILRFKVIAEKHKKEINDIAREIKRTNRFVSKPFLLPYRALIYSFLSKSKPQLKREFKRHLVESFKKMRNSVIVACFGSSFDNILMWSHYASKHKGACIEFEIDDDDFKNVTYSKFMPPYQLCQTLELFYACSFLNKEIDGADERYRFAYSPLVTKSTVWEYEGEVRCVYSAKKLDPKIFRGEDAEGNPALFLSMPKIKRIYLGCNATKEFKKNVKDVCGNIPIVEMEIKENEYGLVAKKPK